MSNTTYRKLYKIKIAPPQPETPPEEVSETYEDYEDYEEVNEQPSGLLNTPGRAMALGGAIVMLVVILAAAFWLMSTPTGNAGNTSAGSPTEGITVGKIAKDFSLVNVRTNQAVRLS